MSKNFLVAQSGGPTAAINATLVGIVQRAMTSSEIDKIYGARNGIKGLLEEKLVDIGESLADTWMLNVLATTPSAALGSCRLKLKDPEVDPSEFEQIIEILHRYNIGYFVYIGGNDSMDTVCKLDRFIKERGIDDIKVMGAPKTIDNDLCEIDHTPGFGSAAKYIATTIAELSRDCRVYDIPAVTIVEIMGRNAGWLAASSALAKLSGCGAPHLIYLPEVPVSVEKFVADVKEQLRHNSAVVIAVSEGVRGLDGNYIAESQQSGDVDAFGHKYLAGTGRFFEQVVRSHIGCKTRNIELNIVQRCAGHILSATDIQESKMLGEIAAHKVLEGVSGEMATLVRKSSKPYRVTYGSVPVSILANREKCVPREWINEEGNYVLDEFMDYVLPLIQGEMHVPYENGVPVHCMLY